MKISVTAKPKSKKEGVEKLSETEFVVRVSSPPVEGKANKRIIELLAQFFKIPQSKVTLVKGNKGKTKIFEVDQG